MPHLKEVGDEDVRNHYRCAQILRGAPSLEEAIELAGKGKLKLECSSFSDPGEDYTALSLEGKRITYWPGY